MFKHDFKLYFIKYFLSKIKKKARSEGARIIFEDEAGFRQDPTLHRTWSRVGEQPQVSQFKKRKGIKVLGCVDIEDFEFKFGFEEVLEARIAQTGYLAIPPQRLFPIHPAGTAVYFNIHVRIPCVITAESCVL